MQKTMRICALEHNGATARIHNAMLWATLLFPCNGNSDWVTLTRVTIIQRRGWLQHPAAFRLARWLYRNPQIFHWADIQIQHDRERLKEAKVDF